MTFIQGMKQWAAKKLSAWGNYGGATINVRMGGRQTQPNEYGISSAFLGRQYQNYHCADLSDLQNWEHKSILKILRQISPEASLAITTFLRVFDSGYIVSCKKKNGEDHEQAKRILTAWISDVESDRIDRFNMPHKIRDIALKWALDSLVKGAADAELVLDENLQPIEPAYVDPWSIDFFWNEGEKRWLPRQTQITGTVGLDIPTFIHVPVDPLGNDPYGEEQITSAIRAIIFKAVVLQDLRQVVHTNGWPRLDFSILEEAVLKSAPPDVKADQGKLNTFIQAQLNSIISMYKDLNPDDNIVHTDSVEVKRLEGGTTGNRSFAAEPLLNVIDNQIANGLKTFSVLLSKKFGGGSEGFTSSEMILYVKLVIGWQRIIEALLERIFALVLRFKGIIAIVDVDFKKPELRTEMELAQWRTVEIQNIVDMFDEQAIGEAEKRDRLREIGGFTGATPSDLSKERITGNGNPNQPERPSSAEPAKESKRKETNRRRRSGQGPQTTPAV